MNAKIAFRNTLVILLCVSVVGCASIRYATMVDVPDIGVRIATKYRYYCVGMAQEDFHRWLDEGKEDAENAFLPGKTLDAMNQLGLSKFQPNVFSQNGIPILVARRLISDERWGHSDAAKLGWFVFYMCTAGLLPFNAHGSEEEMQIQVAIAYDESIEKQILIKERRDEIDSMFTPLAFLFYHGKPTFSGHEKSKVFSKTVCRVGAGPCYTGDEALAYGLAVKLKELEDAGKITDATMQNAAAFHRRHKEARRHSLLTKAMNQSSLALNPNMHREVVTQIPPANVRQIKPAAQVANAYTLDRFTWESDMDYACSFAVRMNEACTIESFYSIENEFREYIRNSYIQSHPSADTRLLIVDVRPSLDNGRVIGRAVVLTISPQSLAYDSDTRRGKLSIRFNPGQYEEARAWARKNIETLARDKNIALTTGQLPPNATYYSLGESVKDGNILEIEFKTE